jgi:pilus assembly protein CpaB
MKRLTPAAVTLLTFAVVVMLVTAYVAKRLFAEGQRQPAPQLARVVSPAAVINPKPPAKEFREIPVAICNLKPGTELKAEYLGTRRVWTEALEPDALLEERYLVGRVVKQRIAASAPIRVSQLCEPGEQPPLEVERKMRAVSVSLSPLNSQLARFAKAGQFVDVHFTPKHAESPAGRNRGELTLTLLSGVRVLAVAGADSKSDSPQSVTLEVTPEQANILILARNRGEIALSYNPDGQGTGGVPVMSQDRATLERILGQKPADPSFTSETYKGNVRSTLSFKVGTPAESH